MSSTFRAADENGNASKAIWNEREKWTETDNVTQLNGTNPDDEAMISELNETVYLMHDKNHVTASLRYCMLYNFHVIATTLEWQEARQKVLCRLHTYSNTSHSQWSMVLTEITIYLFVQSHIQSCRNWVNRLIIELLTNKMPRFS